MSTGRRSIELDVAEVYHLISMGFTRTKIAEMLQKDILKLDEYKLSTVAPKFSNMDDTQLTYFHHCIHYKQTHPNVGEVMVKAHLMQKGFCDAIAYVPVFIVSTQKADR